RRRHTRFSRDWSSDVCSSDLAADSDREARRLATTQQMSFANLLRGARGLSQPPIDDIDSYWSPMEKAQAEKMLARSVIGSRDTRSEERRVGKEGRSRCAPKE